MPPDLTPAQRKGRKVILAILLATVLWTTWKHFTAEAGPAADFPEVDTKLAVPVPEVVWFDSVTGLPARRIPTDLGGEVLFTDTLSGGMR